MGSGKKGTDPTRAERKAKKRKLEDAIPNVPGDNEIIPGESEGAAKSEEPPKKRKRDHDDGDAEENGIKKEKRSKKEKKDKKKSKKNHSEGEPAPAAEAMDVSAEPDKAVEADDVPKKSKKERKAERKAREAADAAANKDAEGPAASSSTGPESNGAPADTDAKEKKPKKDSQKKEKKIKTDTEKPDSTNANGEKTSGKAARFIVFIGSLPYTATTASIQKHFASVKPTSVRSPMQKEDATKSKGYAFLEFDGYDHMKTCLKLFHHSMFDDGVSPPRKISVELTAGGGGNTKDRKEKIKAKNDKLNEERHRRIHEEAKAKAEKRDGGIDESNIHPSRRTRVPGV